MPNIRISVQNKIARAVRRDGCIVCGNSDYAIVFSFDEEWAQHEQKTARFVWDGNYFDVEFEGNACPVPYVARAAVVEVGVYAGELRTTTAALIPCRPSIRSDATLKASPEAVEFYNGQAQAAAAAAREAQGKAEQAQSGAEEALHQAQLVVSDTQAMASEAQRAATSAKATAQSAETTAEEAVELAREVEENSTAVNKFARQLDEHTRVRCTRIAFTVGESDELSYLTADSTGVFSVSQGYRYNDKQDVTVYRYPLDKDATVASAIWHAHLAQQHLLQVSKDGTTWRTLYDTGGLQLGTQAHYDLAGALSLDGAEAVYVKISDSNPADGFGGAILSDIPVTLDITYGTPYPHLLPMVGIANEGAYLRVVRGRWQVADETTLTSRVYTVAFRIGEGSESKYLMSASTSKLNDICRFNDEARFTLYRYHVPNAALVRRVLWTATMGQQLKVECSNDGENWKPVYDAGSTRLPFASMTFDLTSRLNLLAFDEIYIRVSDSEPSDGFGGALSLHSLVELHLERCEPPIYFN